MKQNLKLPWCIIINLLLVYICYSISRLAFLFCNWNLYADNITMDSLILMAKGGFMFDTSAIFYTNLPYILLVVLPIHLKETQACQMIAKFIFVTINSICIILNLIDCVYFPFSHHRSTIMVLDEFKDNTNIGTIFGHEFINHWYLVLLAGVMIYTFFKLYVNSPQITKSSSIKEYYVRNIFSLILFAGLTVVGIRGGATKAIRPITVSNAHQYVTRPLETGIVLNTPFSLIRTSAAKPVDVPSFYSPEELDKIYCPIYEPSDSLTRRNKNVVIIIVESFAREFIGALNTDLDNGTYKGYTTFADSLIHHSLTWKNAFANGGLSIDAIPSVLMSIPEMEISFALSPYALNDVEGLASHLGKMGYSSAFFHGAENSSMGFQAMARAAGFKEYFGRTEYENDSNFGGTKDFDGTWAIWDEEFLQYYCRKMNEMAEPFVTGVFTASSHHPFKLPERYKNVYKEEGKYPLHKCIRYTDNALRKFFATAKKQGWYKNTIFIITADHASSKITHPEYNNEVGLFKIPLIIFDPSEELPREIVDGVAQQIDIMPTILNYLGYDEPYIAFGNDLLNKSNEERWAFSWENNLPRFIQGEYVIQFHEGKVSKVFNYIKDPALKEKLKGR